MLKLEKSGRNREIAVRVRSREPTFSRPLLIALSIAIGIHLGAALLIYIKPLLIESERLLPASQVEIQIDQTQQPLTSTTSSINTNERSLRYTVAIRSPTKPQLPIAMLDRPGNLSFESKADNQNDRMFSSLEFQLNNLNLKDIIFFPFQKLRIEIAGDLQNAKMKIEPISDMLVQQISSVQPKSHQIKYEVKLLNRTGKIYWDNVIESSGHAQIDKQGAQILKMLKFEPNKEGFDTTGEITLILTEGVVND